MAKKLVQTTVASTTFFWTDASEARANKRSYIDGCSESASPAVTWDAQRRRLHRTAGGFRAIEIEDQQQYHRMVWCR
jgi:hypothetical protein